MDQVQCVSLPRSGHNLLVVHLQKYFRSSRVCESVASKRSGIFGRSSSPSSPVQPTSGAGLPDDGQFHYCEYYYACRNHPCVEAGNHFQKSHDFDLDLPLREPQKYLIQRRRPAELLISWFEMRLLKNREKDTAAGFKAFTERMRPYVDGFENKWIKPAFKTNQPRLIFDYDQYLSEPVDHLATAIQFFDASHTPDLSHIRNIVADVRPARDNQNFRFAAEAKLVG